MSKEQIRGHVGWSPDYRAQALHAGERRAVHDLGEAIGYGNMMALAEQEWRAKLAREYPGTEGGEHSRGCCVAFLVPCPCTDEDFEIERSCGSCAWCCGALRVTKRVAQAMRALPAEER